MLRLFSREPKTAARELTEIQQQAVRSLRDDGVAIVRFSDLFDDGSLWEELGADSREFVESTERRLPSLSPEEIANLYGKTHLVRRFLSKDMRPWPQFEPANPWLRFGASTAIVGIIDAYRGRPSWLQEFDLWYTVPKASATERTSSQRWHRDGRENHIMKVFTYFSDVDDEAGPFEYIRGSAGDGKYGSLFPWQKQEVYPPQDELTEAIDQEDFLTLTGSPGTVVICDTSGFHRGGFARSKPRVLSFHTYLSDDVSRKKRKFDVDWSPGKVVPPTLARDALT